MLKFSIYVLGFSIFFSSLIFGCASRNVEVKPFSNNATYEKDFDETWTKLIRYLSTNQIGIATIEKSSGLIVLKNEYLSPELTGKFCATNAPFMYAPGTGILDGSIIASSKDGFTTVTVNTSFQTRYIYQNHIIVNACQSLGVFETELLNALK